MESDGHGLMALLIAASQKQLVDHRLGILAACILLISIRHAPERRSGLWPIDVTCICVPSVLLGQRPLLRPAFSHRLSNYPSFVENADAEAIEDFLRSDILQRIPHRYARPGAVAFARCVREHF